jgi:excisionase family DNA binding protein
MIEETAVPSPVGSRHSTESSGRFSINRANKSRIDSLTFTETVHSLRRVRATHCRRSVATSSGLPTLLTPAEVAGLLRTSKRAIYAMIGRGQLPGVVRIGRRVLLREADLVEWVRQKSAPSPKE